MATSSLSLRFGGASGGGSGSGLHALLGGGGPSGEGDYEGVVYNPGGAGGLLGGGVSGPGGGVGGVVPGLGLCSSVVSSCVDSLSGGGALMTVDTNHHSILSSLPSHSGGEPGGYGKMLCLGEGPGGGGGLPDFGGYANGKDDFEDKFNAYQTNAHSGGGPSNSSLAQQQPPTSRSGSGGDRPGAKGSHSSSSSSPPSAASKQQQLKSEREILNNDLNIVSEGQNDVTIEYMDLDEFLHENGLSNVCKGDDPLSHPCSDGGGNPGGPHLSSNPGGPSSMEKHYPVSLQQRGPLQHPEAAGPEHLLTPVSTSASSLTCIIPSLGPGGASLGHRLSPLDVYGTEDQQNRQCSPGSSNSLASPSSGCSGELASGRGRRRSSTKSIDSCRSLSPGTDGESLLGGKTGLEGRVIKRSKKEMVPDIKKDATYWKKREKNNLAAKRSRDSRREREAQISYKTKFLENENASLQNKVDKCIRQIEDLKKRLSKYEPV